jgi:hypothetical protein
VDIIWAELASVYYFKLRLSQVCVVLHDFYLCMCLCFNCKHVRVLLINKLFQNCSNVLFCNKYGSPLNNCKTRDSLLGTFTPRVGRLHGVMVSRRHPSNHTKLCFLSVADLHIRLLLHT